LAERGFVVREMNAGWNEWVVAGLPMERGIGEPSSTNAS
jgi:3-mercaptopyruvate sulfurtransferase SseA